MTRSKKNYLFFKIDFKKAYDIESWNFLRFIMKNMRFRERWIKRMEASAFSSFLSILVNGNPTVDFEVERGLRQRDPLSSFLFVLVTEGLAKIIRNVVSIGVFFFFLVFRLRSGSR